MQPPSTFPDALLAKILARIPTTPPPYTASTTPSTPPASMVPTPPASNPTPSPKPIELTIDTAISILGHRNTVHVPDPQHPSPHPHRPSLLPAGSPVSDVSTDSVPSARVVAAANGQPEIQSQALHVWRLLTVLRAHPYAKDRGVQIKMTSGVKICGSGNTLVVGGATEGLQLGLGEGVGGTQDESVPGRDAAVGEKRKRDDEVDAEMPETKKSA
ncbi:hypothetical protein MMC13_004285 [Lambiella insularis]|nr:hypothetical protein [Lambiella insularis]